MDDGVSRGASFLDEAAAAASKKDSVASKANVVSTASPWMPPQPLVAPVPNLDYPLAALPDGIRLAVLEVNAFVKAPIAMVASSALAAVSVSTQALIDVERSERLQGPTALYFLTIADSGERKSTLEDFFLGPVKHFVHERKVAGEAALQEYESALAVWEAEREGKLAAIRSAAVKGNPVADLSTELTLLESEKPAAPRLPRMLLGDETPESLAYGLTEWPSAGIFSAEAGVILGSHGMGRDSVMRNLSLFNIMWDGGTHTVGRRSSDSFTVRGARLTLALQVQEPTLREFLLRAGAIARGIGFMGRFLLAHPASTQGTRFFTEAPHQWPQLDQFRRRLSELLEQPLRFADDGSLAPRLLKLTAEAKAIWVKYHDTVEAELKVNGAFDAVRDAAAKNADNAARLAALLHVFCSNCSNNSNPPEPIAAATMQSAIAIASWHLHESRRFFADLALPTELADAVRLDRWLLALCRNDGTESVPKNHVRQYGPLRDTTALDAALMELVNLDRLRIGKVGRRTIISCNPALLGNETEAV